MAQIVPLSIPQPRPWRAIALDTMTDRDLDAALGGQDAAAWLDAANRTGNPQTQIRLGRLLLGQPRDPRAAFACFLCAARTGDAEAWYLLGRCYEQGWGTGIDGTRARHAYRQAAEAGDFRGAYNYAGLAAADGCLAGALHWFERALAMAPDAPRAAMIDAMTGHPLADVRAIAEQG